MPHLSSQRRGPRSARCLYWTAGEIFAAAAAVTLAQRALTEVSALLALGGTLMLIWALFKSGRDDAARWAVELLIVGSFLSMLVPYIKR